MHLLTLVQTHLYTHRTGLVRCCSGDEPQPTNPIENDRTVTLSQKQLCLASEVCLSPTTTQTRQEGRIKAVFYFFLVFGFECRVIYLHTVVPQSALASPSPLGLVTV